jgi:hypothetical protein
MCNQCLGLWLRVWMKKILKSQKSNACRVALLIPGLVLVNATVHNRTNRYRVLQSVLRCIFLILNLALNASILKCHLKVSLLRSARDRYEYCSINHQYDRQLISNEHRVKSKFSSDRHRPTRQTAAHPS